MSNKYGIPNKDEEEIRARDKICVYCRKTMKVYPNTKGTPGDKATIEHLNFAPPFYWMDGLKKSDLVICCGSCNASRGKKELLNWFKKQYCLDRNINKDTVAEPVKKYLSQFPSRLKQFIENSKWIFAKTYTGTWPHEYIVQEQVNGDLFLAFANYIDSYGYESNFYETTQVYFDYNGYVYWHMENIINRCPESDTYHRREKEGRLPK